MTSARQETRPRSRVRTSPLLALRRQGSPHRSLLAIRPREGGGLEGEEGKEGKEGKGGVEGEEDIEGKEGYRR